MIKEKRETTYITGGIIYDDGSIESFDEIDKRKKREKKPQKLIWNITKNSHFPYTIR